MMHGSVSNFRATLPVTFRLPHQQDLTIDFVVDTGFTDDLTLPSAAIAALGLPFLYRVPASLADDSTVQIAVHTAIIIWHGSERQVNVLATGRHPLLGTSLLANQELVVQFAESGLVTVDKL